MNTKTIHQLCVGISFIVLFSSASVAYEEITVNNGTTIQGTVKLEGKLPKLPPLQISPRKFANVPNETLIVGAGQGFAMPL
jgi:hypothetical protein